MRLVALLLLLLPACAFSQIVSGIKVNPSSITGGSSFTIKVTLSKPVPQGAGGFLVDLGVTGKGASYVSIPDSLTIPEGASSGAVNGTSSGTLEQVNAVITATDVTKHSITGLVTVIPPRLISAQFSESKVIGKVENDFVVTLNGPAPAEFQLDITQTSGNKLFTISSVFTVPKGTNSCTVPCTALPVVKPTLCAISVDSEIRWGAAVHASFTNSPLQPAAIKFDNSQVTGPGTVETTVTLNAPAPPDGTTATVTTSGATTLASAPKTVTVAAGETTATFLVSVAKTTDSSKSIGLAVSLNGKSVTGTIIDKPTHVPNAWPQTILFSSSNVIGPTTVQATVTMSAAADSYGISLQVVATDGAALVTLPTSLTVGPGKKSVTFSMPVGAVKNLAANISLKVWAIGGNPNQYGIGNMVDNPPPPQ